MKRHFEVTNEIRKAIEGLPDIVRIEHLCGSKGGIAKAPTKGILPITWGPLNLLILEGKFPMYHQGGSRVLYWLKPSLQIWAGPMDVAEASTQTALDERGSTGLTAAELEVHLADAVHRACSLDARLRHMGLPLEDQEDEFERAFAQRAEAPLEIDHGKISTSMQALQDLCHGLAVRSGWWTHTATGINLKAVISNPESGLAKLLAGALVGQKLCLTHSEISEGMEGHRKGLADDKLPHRPMFEVEMADAIIRILDLSGAMGLDIGGAIAEKLAFNQVRPDHKPEAREAEGGKAY